jgi:hypothetical protein
VLLAIAPTLGPSDRLFYEPDAIARSARYSHYVDLPRHAGSVGQCPGNGGRVPTTYRGLSRRSFAGGLPRLSATTISGTHHAEVSSVARSRFNSSATSARRYEPTTLWNGLILAYLANPRSSLGLRLVSS